MSADPRKKKKRKVMVGVGGKYGLAAGPRAIDKGREDAIDEIHDRQADLSWEKSDLRAANMARQAHLDAEATRVAPIKLQMDAKTDEIKQLKLERSQGVQNRTQAYIALRNVKKKIADGDQTQALKDEQLELEQKIAQGKTATKAKKQEVKDAQNELVGLGQTSEVQEDPDLLRDVTDAEQLVAAAAEDVVSAERKSVKLEIEESQYVRSALDLYAQTMPGKLPQFVGGLARVNRSGRFRQMGTAFRAGSSKRFYDQSIAFQKRVIPKGPSIPIFRSVRSRA